MKKTTLTALLIAASILASCSKGSNDAQQGMANDTIAEDSVEQELVLLLSGKTFAKKIN